MPSIITVGNESLVGDPNKPKIHTDVTKIPAPDKALPISNPVDPKQVPVDSILSQKPQPVQLRDFGDHDSTRKWMYDGIMEAVKGMEPVKNSRYSLGIVKPYWADADKHTIDDRKKAILRGDTLFRRLKGTWQLKDLEGKLIEEKEGTIANVPHLTGQGTFVINGSEYTLATQMRLHPGVFARKKENGEIESHINVMPGKGISHHYFLEPATGIFKLKIGQAHLPLISVLRSLGATDKEITEAWGNDKRAQTLVAANAAKDDPKVTDKLYDRLIGKKGNPDATGIEKQKAIADEFMKMQLNPDVTKRTLGQPISHISKEMILKTTKKLLDISRGESETDDRDHLAFQHFMGPEDLFSERISKNKGLLTDLLWKATHKGSIKTLPSGAFTKHVNAALMDSGLGQNTEEVNPLDLLDQHTRVTRLGIGGIPSLDSVPDEARSVQPSHLSFIDLVRTPESLKVGIDSRMAYVAKKGSDGKVYAPFINMKTGKQEYKNPQEIADLKVAFPGELDKNEPLVYAQVGGKTKKIPRDQVDYVMPHMENSFSPINNLVPLKSALKGQRAAMASRFLTQALPLKDAEAPFVRSQVPNQPGKSFDEYYSPHVGAVYAPEQSGRVMSVSPEEIKVRYADGTIKSHELFNNLVYNRKTLAHNTPLVQTGDPVKPGQLLAKSNFTDDTGAIALGKNLRTAYIPFRGLNHEDAYVISESAAKKLTSEHAYQHNVEWEKTHKKGRNQFISIFPGKFKKDQLLNLDMDGIVKPGTLVKPGDPLILAAKEREISQKQVHSSHKGSFTDNSLTWDHDSEGIVTDVEQTAKGVTVAVKGYSPTITGDKMSGRHAGKGVVADVIPDDQMPHDTQGRPFEVLLNPLGIITRTNPSQIHEAALGKIAEKTGKPYVVNDFDKIHDLNQYVQDELKKHNLKGAEDIIDPATGRTIPNVFTGNRYFMKLHHTSESKGQGRGLGAYSSEGLPVRGGVEGSKKIANQDVTALMSHGAVENLRDIKLIRGQKNQEYWSVYMGGDRPPTPKTPMIYDKFINQLKASGINVLRKGNQTSLMPMTNQSIKELTGDRELENDETVNWKAGLKPIPGGLFDERLTGGHSGMQRWAKITLHEPMPNPAMEEPIRRILGLTKDKFFSILTGKEEFGGKKGPAAIQSALNNINLDQLIKQTQEDVKSSRKTIRDEAIRKLGPLVGAKKQGIHPRDWVIDAIPVIPPLFRPLSLMQGSNTRIVADANYLYHEVFEANNVLKKASSVLEDVSDERANLYNAYKGVTGFGEPTHPKNVEKELKGFLGQIFSNSPKYGIVQQKLLGTPVDLVGRAVITPNPDLNMDEVGLPEQRAWEIYTPFIARRMVKHGTKRLQAMEYIKNRDPLAKKAMLDEIAERPVIMTRAPVLHRYGEMAFFPKLTKGNTLQVCPTIVKGFGADFDGDAQNYHVPASDEARQEAIEKMLPSKNLLNTKSFKPDIYSIQQEYLGGLYAGTSETHKDKKPRIFATKQDAMNAINRKELDPRDPITIVSEK